ncbi:Gx transporter family protein [Mycoplasmatota bacterium WC44]
MRNTRKMVFMAILTSLSVVLGIIDAQLAAFVTLVPYAKVGLANIVILLSIIYFDFKDGLTMAILKSVLIGLILGAVSTFFIGFSGTMLSFFGMLFFYKVSQGKFSLIGISVIGGVLHSVGQIIAVMTFYKSVAAITFLPQLLLTSLLTGVIIGMLTNSIKRYIDNARIFQK